MDKANLKQLIGIATCLGVVIWAHIYGYYHEPQLGSPGYLVHYYAIQKAPAYLFFVALGVIIAGLLGVSLLFKNKHRFWTFWIIYLLLSDNWAFFYLIYLWVRKHLFKPTPAMSVEGVKLQMKRR